MGDTTRRSKTALKLPDQLLVRYFCVGEIEDVRKVVEAGDAVTVTVGKRVDRWTDLGGGLGYVPDEAAG